MPARVIGVANLVVGLLFCALVVVLSVGIEVAARHLPGDPDAFRAALERFDAVRQLGLPLGFLLQMLAIADLARARSLRSRRARLRLATLLLVVVLGGIAAAELEPFLAALAAQPDGALLQAMTRDERPWVWAARGIALAVAACLVAAHRTPAPAPPEVDTDGRYAAAWVPPIFGRTPALPHRQWQVLGLMVAAGLFNAYDQQIFSLALKQIQAELAIHESRLGYLGSVVKLGIVPGVLLVLLGDVLGRRRLLLVTILGYTLSTGATALAPGEWSFVVFQFLSRMFGAAEATLAAVVVAEEVDAEDRGWALGVLSALAFLGIALAWVLFAMIDSFPQGWRGLYLVGLGPLLLLSWLRRRLPETARFEREAARRGPVGPWRSVIRPLGSLARGYPVRLGALSAVGFLMAFSGQSAGFFFPKMMQDVHGIAPSQLTMLAAGVGLAGLVALPLVGRLGDRVGRRPVVMAFIFLNPLAVIGLYNAVGVALLGVFFLAMTVTDIGSDMNLGVYARELFPTSHRATAGAVAGIVTQLGGSLGLAAESVLYGCFGSHGSAVSALALAGLLVPLLVWRFFPETRGRSLEEISPER